MGRPGAGQPTPARKDLAGIADDAGARLAVVSGDRATAVDDLAAGAPGKVALVTGASRGIGEATARCYAAAGADVALVARSEAELARVAESLRASGRRAMAIRCDVRDADDVQAAVVATLDHFGQIDVLVNNAGGLRFNATFLDTREEGWHKVIDLNLNSVMRFLQRVGPHMVTRGTGSVINVTSGPGSPPTGRRRPRCST